MKRLNRTLCSHSPVFFRALPFLSLALCLMSTACFSLSAQEKIALDGYKQNSKAYYNSGKYMETIDQCQKGLEIDEDDYSLNLTLAWALLRTGTKPYLFQAYTQFELTESLRWFNDDFRIALGLGQSCYKIAMLYHQKLESFNQRMEIEPEAALLFQDEIEECRQGKERYIEEALVNLLDTLSHERQRDNLEAILTLGEAYAYNQEYEKSIEYLIKGLELLENSTVFQKNQLETDSSVTTDGRRFLEREVRRNMRWERELRGVLAFVYRRTGELEKVLEQYAILEEKELFDEVQHYNRALVLQDLGLYTEAIEEFDQYLRQGSVTGRKFDEDIHFQLAIQKQEECRQKLKEMGGAASPTTKSVDGE